MTIRAANIVRRMRRAFVGASSVNMSRQSRSRRRNTCSTIANGTITSEPGSRCGRTPKPSTRFIFGDALGDPEADAILQALRLHPEGLMRIEISTLFSGNRKSGEIQRALGTLVELASPTANWSRPAVDLASAGTLPHPRKKRKMPLRRRWAAAYFVYFVYFVAEEALWDGTSISRTRPASV
jgi:hypothetical protein